MKRTAYLSDGKGGKSHTHKVPLKRNMATVVCRLQMQFPWLPWSISVTQHSSRAPEGLWTFASITPFAPFRLTANDAGWFTFKPDSCSTTHAQLCHNISEPKHNDAEGRRSYRSIKVRPPLTWRLLARLKRKALDF